MGLIPGTGLQKCWLGYLCLMAEGCLFRKHSVSKQAGLPGTNHLLSTDRSLSLRESVV